MSRQIILDTETTGLDPLQGHRVIEIGCVELLNRKLTGERFHAYINPERAIDPGAVEVHGLSSEFLADKPRFKEIAGDFLKFIEGSELIIHNAPFDVGFLNHEIGLHDARLPKITGLCSVIDTLVLARKKHPGQRNSLDALCKRYGIDNSQRSLHGALLDAEILAEVYLAMTGGQISLSFEQEEERKPNEGSDQKARKLNPNRPRLKVIQASESELSEHFARIEEIDRQSGGRCLFKMDH